MLDSHVKDEGRRASLRGLRDREEVVGQHAVNVKVLGHFLAVHDVLQDVSAGLLG
jgi:hypothetical protein